MAYGDDIDVIGLRLSYFSTSSLYLLVCIAVTQCAAFQFRCEPVNTNFTCMVTNYNPKQEGTFLFNHMPERTNNIDFKNVILAVVDNTIFGYIPAAVSTLTLSGSSAVRAIIVPQNISLFEIVVAEPSMVRMRFEKNCTLSRLQVTQSSLIAIPPTLGNLQHLSFFKLNQSPIEQISLERFCNLSQLQSLNFKYNLIATISFQGAIVPWCGPALVKLAFANNKLRIVNMTVFASMRELRILDLENNLIEIVEGHFTNPKITTVILTNNKLLAIDLCRWNAMLSIISFSFNKNSLQLIPKCLQRMPAVQFINFNNNKLTKINIEAFAMLNELKSLFFSNNAIRSIVNYRRPVPSSLKEVYMEHNPLGLENVTKFFPSSVKIYT
ncbi:phospholipase A2 inhibitor beta-like [Anopheles moucheti]|uniref:phospholipase A2 inhibitor beta-like n=1 Tax=Anopheles moucheti TaxID=186751 RepID=UPI0022EFDBAF|nr:phospholipase A2 inhibitor beta-like [Anopheles moucheti]